MKKLLLLLLSFVLLSCNQSDIDIYKLKVGQTWTYSTGGGNPFRDYITKDQKIIAISSGYVQYVENSDTLSCSKKWFVIGNTLHQPY